MQEPLPHPLSHLFSLCLLPVFFVYSSFSFSQCLSLCSLSSRLICCFLSFCLHFYLLLCHFLFCTHPLAHYHIHAHTNTQAHTHTLSIPLIQGYGSPLDEHATGFIIVYLCICFHVLSVCACVHACMFVSHSGAVQTDFKCLFHCICQMSSTQSYWDTSEKC